MNTGGSWNFDWGRVKQTYARHSSSFADGTYGGNPNGYILHAEDKCIYNLGDTALFHEMEYIGNQHKIGRASCREREEKRVVAVEINKKENNKIRTTDGDGNR